MSSTYLDMKPLHAIKVATKPHIVGYVTPQFQKFHGRQGNMKEYVVCLLEPIGAPTNDADLCLREFSKP